MYDRGFAAVLAPQRDCTYCPTNTAVSLCSYIELFFYLKGSFLFLLPSFDGLFLEATAGHDSQKNMDLGVGFPF